MSKVSDSDLAWAEKAELMTPLPGWKGYKERDLIRQDDALVRNFVKDHLMKVQEKVLDYGSTLVAENPFNPKLPKVELLKSRMRTLIEEVSSAPAGMLSYYSRFKFTNKEQQALVDFDLKLLESTKKLLTSAISPDLNGDLLTAEVLGLHDQMFERNKIFYPPKIQQ